EVVVAAERSQVIGHEPTDRVESGRLVEERWCHLLEPEPLEYLQRAPGVAHRVMQRGPGPVVIDPDPSHYVPATPPRSIRLIARFDIPVRACRTNLINPGLSHVSHYEKTPLQKSGQTIGTL